ncbi:MAG: HypC/HybG/HupF family hydrogenase formation chaperone [Gemmatimonadales bacterium]
MSQPSSDPTCGSSTGERCTLCGDEGLPGVVVSLNARERTAVVRLADGPQTVALDLVDGVETGQTVLVHQGFAIARMEPS